MENWNKISFTELISDRTKDGIKLPTNEYNQSGLTAIIDQGQEFIAGYSDETEGAFTDVPAIIFGDHTRVFKYVDFPFFLGADGVKVLKANQEINYKYLYYYFLQAKFPNTGYARHFKWLKELQIPLPPLEEQKHIAAVLDKCTALIAKHKLMLEKYDTLIKSRFIEMFGDPVTNPMGWEVKKLGDICTKISDGVHAKPEYTATGKPFISVVNINSGKLLFDDCKYVSEEAYEKMIKSTHPEKGDILYTKVGATYGIPALVDTDRAFCLYVSVALLKPKSEIVNSQFLTTSMAQPYIKNQADKRIKGIGVPDLHLNQIREFEVLVPPLELQNQFNSFVQQIDKSKFVVQKSLEKAETLYKSLMQEYFG